MDKKICETCPARFICRQHGIRCGSDCPLWIEMRYQLALSCIPKRHQKFQIEELKDNTIKVELLRNYGKEIIQNVDVEHLGLYLYGNTGSGKTTALCAIGMSYIAEASKQAVNKGTRTKQMVQFINMADLLDGIKRGFDDPIEAEVWSRRLRAAKTAKLLLLDDIGAEKPSEWARERLTDLINYRYDNELTTLISSNLSLKQLQERIDPVGRITSRIKGMAAPVEYRGKDRREI